MPERNSPVSLTQQVADIQRQLRRLRVGVSSAGGGGTGSQQIAYSGYYNGLGYPGISVAQSGVASNDTEPVVQTFTDRFFAPDSTTAHAAISYDSTTGEWALSDPGVYTIWVVASVYNSGTTSGRRTVYLNDPAMFPAVFTPAATVPADTRSGIETQIQLFATGYTVGGAGNAFTINVQSSVSGTFLDGLHVGIVKHAQFVP